MLRYKEHKDKLVKRAVIQALPRLARVQADVFLMDYLNSSINYLLALLKKKEVCFLFLFLFFCCC